MVEQDLADDLAGLVDLVAGMADIKSVLDGLTGLAAASMSSTVGVPIECAVTLHRRKRTATIGGSSGRATVIDRIEQSLGDGPCIEALESGVPVLLGDVASDPPVAGVPQRPVRRGYRRFAGYPDEIGGRRRSGP